MGCRGDDSALVQSSRYSSGFAVIQSNDLRHILALQFPIGENMRECTVRVLHDAAEPLLFLRPVNDSLAQGRRLHEFGHEPYLIEASLQKKDCEARESLFVQSATTVEIISASKVACGKMLFVLVLGPGQAASNRPYSSRVERFEKVRV